MSGAAASARDGRAAQAVAAARLAALPVLLVEERAGPQHPAQTVFAIVLALAAVYALAMLAASVRRPARPPGGFGACAACDLALLAALGAASGGPYSQVRSALAVLPLVVAALGDERQTALMLGGSLAAWLGVALVHPGVPAADGGYLAAQTLSLAWRGGIALPFAFVLGSWRRRMTAVAEGRQALVAQAQNAEERARRRLAYALHDGPVQNLLSARLALECARGGDLESLERAGTVLTDTVGELRDAIFELHPHVLDEIGLPAALAQLAGRQPVPVVATVDPDAAGPHDALLFALARELLCNAGKHAAASEVTLALAAGGGQVVLEVADDGVGFDGARADAARRAGHIGLPASVERVEAAGGRMSVDSAAGAGTRVRVELPTAAQAAPPRRFLRPELVSVGG